MRESQFLLFLVPHPFLAVCGKTFTSCLHSAFPWSNSVFFGQGQERTSSLHISPSSALFYLIYFYCVEETLGECSLGFPGLASLEEEEAIGVLLGRFRRKVRQPRVQASQQSARV